MNKRNPSGSWVKDRRQGPAEETASTFLLNNKNGVNSKESTLFSDFPDQISHLTVSDQSSSSYQFPSRFL